MSATSLNSSGATTPSMSEALPLKTRSIHYCNFRTATRLSNEDARAITALHDKVAQRISSVLDAYLGTAIDVRFGSLVQYPAKDHIASLPATSYVVPFSSSKFIVEFTLDLIFPIIELLMGGTGEAKEPGRELSEIEEEIMKDIVLLVAQEAEDLWRIPDLELDAETRISPSAMFQIFRPSEKLTVLPFECTIGSTSGSFNMVLSTPACDALIKSIKANRPLRKNSVWNFPVPPLRERMLDCEVEVIAELANLKVSVRDLVMLEPGSVLKLHAPIRAPGMLMAGGRGLFEAVPVRSNSQRAAQLGRRTETIDWKMR